MKLLTQLYLTAKYWQPGILQALRREECPYIVPIALAWSLAKTTMEAWELSGDVEARNTITAIGQKHGRLITEEVAVHHSEGGLCITDTMLCEPVAGYVITHENSGRKAFPWYFETVEQARDVVELMLATGIDFTADYEALNKGISDAAKAALTAIRLALQSGDI